MPLSAEQRAARVQAIVFDVDGVLTRGDIVYGPLGEWKVFNVRDGQGFDAAWRVGLKTALLTARSCEALRRRAMDLHLTALEEGVKDKGAGFEGLVERIGVPASDVCYVGDDLMDLAALRRAGFPVAVADAADEVKKAAAWVTTRRGGEGAAREVIEFVLKARALWDEAVRKIGEGGT